MPDKLVFVVVPPSRQPRYQDTILDCTTRYFRIHAISSTRFIDNNSSCVCLAETRSFFQLLGHSTCTLSPILSFLIRSCYFRDLQLQTLLHCSGNSYVARHRCYASACMHSQRKLYIVLWRRFRTDHFHNYVIKSLKARRNIENEKSDVPRSVWHSHSIGQRAQQGVNRSKFEFLIYEKRENAICNCGRISEEKEEISRA